MVTITEAVIATIAITPSSPSVMRKAGRWGAQCLDPREPKTTLEPPPIGNIHRNSEHITAEPAKQHVGPAQSPGGSREEASHAQGWAWTPELAAPGLACLAQRGAGSQMLVPSWFSLAFPQRPGVWPLPSPRSRWPLQPGTCPWRMTARKVQTQGLPCVSSESLHEAHLLPGGARRGLS